MGKEWGLSASSDKFLLVQIKNCSIGRTAYTLGIIDSQHSAMTFQRIVR